MNISKYSIRREKLRFLMSEHNLEALLVTLDANRFYLSGFELHDPQPNESAGCLLILQNGNDQLCTDARYYDAARRLWDENAIFIYQGNAARQTGEYLYSLVGTKAVGFDPRHISLDFYEQFAGSNKLVRAQGLIEILRSIKDDEEIEAIRQSCIVNEKMMQWLPDELIPGKSEAQVSWEIEQFFRNNGAQENAFASIVAVEENAALPHAIPSDKKIKENNSVLIDVGCRFNDYCSDQTRTFWVGNSVNTKFLDNLHYVQEAQQKAIEAIRPGAKTADIYRIALSHLESKGVGKFFTHGLGHGVGLQTHEYPSLGAASNSVLKAGMVITVEPGVYYSGEFGIRWEHMVVVTEDGYKIL